ncbi:MAG: ATP-binding cassette domain-containing protein [Acetobacteraceae bacterium]|nr:ATP-binding cassette domain-containing protein [Acetobacteraceae bacterium]
MPGDDALEVLIATKAFALPTRTSHIVLRDIHFTALPGQVVALLGRSGSGKSTLLRIVLGLDTVFEGRVRMPPGRLGVVFQDPRLLPWLTVADNLRLVLVDGAAKTRIEEMLELVGVADAANHLPSELSLGMARRVALARALAVDPNVLVLDEPFASLDRQLGTMLVAKVAERTRRTGCIMLFATHDLDHALMVADRICVLGGHPTTLKADVAVPAQRNAGTIERLRTELVAQFRFLGSEETAQPL